MRNGMEFTFSCCCLWVCAGQHDIQYECQVVEGMKQRKQRDVILMYCLFFQDGDRKAFVLTGKVSAAPKMLVIFVFVNIARLTVEDT